ncbi:MAG TPA: SpoIIE family protein phosphatase, partial [Actinopolymorphaceae bacterium]
MPYPEAQLEQMSSAAAAVVAARDVAGVLHQICRQSVLVTGAVGACAHLFGGEGFSSGDEMTRRVGIVPAHARDVERHAGDLQAHLGPVAPGDPLTTDQVTIPLTIRDRVIGALCLWNLPDPPPARAVLLRLTRVAGAALNNATRFEQQRALAVSLQQMLLPENMPEVPGSTVCTRYRPASTGVQVGGDWYDIVPLPAGRFAFVIGDVSGHDVRAASVMGQVRMALRAYGIDADDPVEIVSRLNRLLSTLQINEFVTLLCCVWDPPTRTAQVVRAGHPPLVVIRNGTAEVLETVVSPPVGVEAFSGYEAEEVVLQTYDRLLMFSDGLVERRRESIDAGLERLVSHASSYQGSLDGLCDELLEKLPGAETEDDIAILGVDIAPSAADRIGLDFPARMEYLSEIRTRLRAWLTDHGGSEQEIYDLMATCEEACSNAIEHAYETGPGTLHVEATIVDRMVEVLVVDEGSWRPRHGSGRGRGLALMEALSDSLEVRHHGHGTAVIIRRSLRPR